MPDHSIQFEAATGGLVLASAILLYRGQALRSLNPYDAPRQNAAAFASIHRVEHDADGRPTIAAGTPLSRAQLRQWTEALGRIAQPEFLPANILVAHADILAWWTPAKVRSGYFALSSSPPDLHLLSKQAIVPVPYPAHLFVATRSGLGAYALPVSRRPTAGTHVLHSPILNVFVDGKLCWGNIPRPRALTAASIPEFESAVFDSWSTHPNPGQELTITGNGGLVRLWDDLATRGARRFPVKRLRPFNPDPRRLAGRTADPATVGKIIAQSLHQ